jgi:hypothetical protein
MVWRDDGQPHLQDVIVDKHIYTFRGRMDGKVEIFEYDGT